MIIFGTTTTRKTLSEGEFMCPQCQSVTAYRERRAKNWGHLYWIPIIPMDEHPPYVECRACKGTFVPEVLQFDHKAEERFLAAFDNACMASCARIAIEGSPATSTQRQAIVELMKSSPRGGVTLDQVDAAIMDAKVRKQTIAEIVKPASGDLNDRGRELMVMNLVEVALAKGKPSASELAMIRECGEAVGMSSAHVRGIVAETEERGAKLKPAAIA
ncbi:zinc-ribbon domain-containing protein [Maricaulis sp.]|uniref:zinc-ribbon domain-containing protein n=1 Tax=Maricaulis sp. TaxID=1486257 RepID=UPI0025C40767|nr:zinc-ribbon domain-containing protein [Maricaulis sp.]